MNEAYLGIAARLHEPAARRPHVRHVRPRLAYRKDTPMSTHNAQPLRGWLPWTAPAPGGEVEHAKPGRCHVCDCTLSKYRSRFRVTLDTFDFGELA